MQREIFFLEQVQRIQPTNQLGKLIQNITFHYFLAYFNYFFSTSVCLYQVEYNFVLKDKRIMKDANL